VLLVFRSSGLSSLLLEAVPRQSPFYNVLHPDLKRLYWKFFPGPASILAPRGFFHATRSARHDPRNNFRLSPLCSHAAGRAPEGVRRGIRAISASGSSESRDRGQLTARGVFSSAGDAAHSHPPYGGLWASTPALRTRPISAGELAATLARLGPGERLLDSYKHGTAGRFFFESTARDFIEKAIQNDRDFLEAPSIRRATRDAFERGSGRSAQVRRPASEVNAFVPKLSRPHPSCGDRRISRCNAVGSHSFQRRGRGHHLAPQPLASGRNVIRRAR